MKYSEQDLQLLLRQAGWPESLIPTAAKIFYYESASGNPYAHKVDSVEQSYGLAQINIDPKLHRPYTVNQLYNPIFNLKVAYQIYQQQGWSAWKNTYQKLFGKNVPQDSTAASPATTPKGLTAIAPVSGDSGLRKVFLLGVGAVLIVVAFSAMKG
jgi:hypothetical protein